MTVAHYMSMTIIGVGSFIFGILPVGFSFRVTRSYPLFLSLILCFGTGVLLSTSLVHMLTEVQAKLQFSAQLYFCAGFLILYTFDEISHFCLGSVHSTEIDVTQKKGTSKRSDYGSVYNPDCQNVIVQESNDKSLNTNNLSSEKSDNLSCNPSQSQCRYNDCEITQNLLCSTSHSAGCHQDQIRYHVETPEQPQSNHVAKTGLLIALLIHSILEGVSIGVQTEDSQIFMIMGAVSFHKFVLSFCLAIELHHHGYKILQLISAIFLFSIGSPIGILVGMSVTSLENGIFSVDAQLQAAAAGSLLYVAAFEVLPRERLKWQRKGNRKAGIFQLIFLLIGFMSITLFHLFLEA